jgi:Zn-dependent peptidase ImmA (M78 family)
MREEGVGEEELAERCGATPHEVYAWLEGKAEPGKTQFGKLVGALRRPSAFFFLPEPPVEGAVGAAFRSPAGVGGPRRLLRDEHEALRSAKRIQQVARWIEEKERAEPPNLPHVGDEDAEHAADRVRRLLGWTVDWQIDADSYRDALARLRGHLEARGILVLHLRMSRKGCRGFSLYDDSAPVIAVNTATVPQARLFSYCHELGHLLRRADRICGATADTALERWCERFAAGFLLPRDRFGDFVGQEFPDQLISEVADVGRISHHFNVSLRAVALRLQDVGLASPGLYDRVHRQTEVSPSRGGGGQRTAARRLSEWGRAYPRALERAERAHLLARQDVLEYLDVSNSQLEELRSLIDTDAPDFED